MRRPVRATITLYPMRRPVRATITLYPIRRHVKGIIITLYPTDAKGAAYRMETRAIQSHN